MNGLDTFAPVANLTAVGALIWLVVWMVTKGFPRILERSEVSNATARQEYLAALDRQTEQRAEAAASGHQVAAEMQRDMSKMAAELQRSNDIRIHELHLKGQTP